MFGIMLNKNNQQDIRQFIRIARDIIHHDFYRRAKEFTHHGGTNTVYKHCVSVGYRSYVICRLLRMGEARTESTVKAALLHDMFGHSFWGNGSNIVNTFKNNKGFKRISRIHAFYHGEEAVNFTLNYVSLSDEQKDAMIRHMFPLYPLPPKHLEGWILTAADKIVAIDEIKDTVIYKLNIQTVRFKEGLNRVSSKLRQLRWLRRLRCENEV